MATDPLQVAGVRWPNQFQQPTGIYSSAVNTSMDPIAIANGQIPAESAKMPFSAKGIDTVPSTDTTRGRVIDVRV